MLKRNLIVFVAIFAVLILGVFIVNGSKNTAITLEENVTTAKSDIEVQEKRRADLIPNLVECVKAYDKHEYETLTAVVAGRNMLDDQSVEDIKNLINLVVEKYPELQSNENYQQLMTELATTENQIARYRSNYNDCVKRYNTYCRSFPASMNLSIVGYTVVNFERLEYNASSDAPVVNFD